MLNLKTTCDFVVLKKRQFFIELLEEKNILLIKKICMRCTETIEYRESIHLLNVHL